MNGGHASLCPPYGSATVLPVALRRRTLVHEADRERAAGERAAQPAAESQRRAALDRGLDRVPIGLPRLLGKSRRHIGDARLAEDFAVAFEAQAHRELGAWPGVLLARRYPAAAQRGEHGLDGAEPFRSLAIGLVPVGSCIGLAIPALDGQLQLLAEGIFEFRRAGTTARSEEHTSELQS